jgi:hypothetical protein
MERIFIEIYLAFWTSSVYVPFKAVIEVTYMGERRGVYRVLLGNLREETTWKTLS